MASGDTGSTTYEPSFHTLLAVENDTGEDETPVNIIASYLGTLTSIPDNWFLCDGTNGTPDLRDKFIKCANVGGDVGNTGGADGHDHTDPAGHTHNGDHTHSVSLATNVAQTSSQNDDTGSGRKAHSHDAANSDSAGGTLPSTVQTVDTTADTQPEYRTMAFLQYPRRARSGAVGFIG